MIFRHAPGDSHCFCASRNGSGSPTIVLVSTESGNVHCNKCNMQCRVQSFIPASISRGSKHGFYSVHKEANFGECKPAEQESLSHNTSFYLRRFLHITTIVQVSTTYKYRQRTGSQFGLPKFIHVGNLISWGLTKYAIRQDPKPVMIYCTVPSESPSSTVPLVPVPDTETLKSLVGEYFTTGWKESSNALTYG